MLIDSFELPEAGSMIDFRFQNNQLIVLTFLQGKVVLEKTFSTQDAEKAIAFYKKECKRRGFVWLATHYDEI